MLDSAVWLPYCGPNCPPNYGETGRRDGEMRERKERVGGRGVKADKEKIAKEKKGKEQEGEGQYRTQRVERRKEERKIRGKRDIRERSYGF